MIVIEFTHKGREVRLDIEGHADSGELAGTICACTSILAYTVAQTLTQLHDAGRLQKPHVDLTSGSGHVCVRMNDECADEVLHTYYVAQSGYRLLAANYPENVRIATFLN